MKSLVFCILLLAVPTSWAGELNLINYLKMQEALASDNFDDALKGHKIICDKELLHYKDSYKNCSVKFKNIEQLRESFKKLSALYLVNGDKKQQKDLITAECPMAKAKWLQTKGSIRNPYYGKSMLECGQAI